MTASPPWKLRWTRAAALVAVVGGVLAAGAPPSAAAACRNSATVADHADDGGRAQLRQAIADACPGALIRITPGTITLTRGELAIEKDLTFLGVGPQARPPVIDAAGASRVLAVTGATVSLTNLTITGGRADTGAAIRNVHGTVTLSDVVVTGNVATGDGGAIHSAGDTTGDASVTLQHSAITSNEAGSRGGGLVNLAAGGAATMTVVDTVVSKNVAPLGGGGANIADDGAATMTFAGASVVEDNVGGRRFGQRGGGLLNLASTGSNVTIVVRDTATVRRNSAFTGAGIANATEGAGTASVSLLDSATLTANAARWTGGGLTNESNGGGTATTTVADDARVDANTSGLTGGGAGNLGADGTAVLLLAGRATMTGNSALAGGGVFNNPGVGAATVSVVDAATLAGNVPDDCYGC
jgi:predicted outer membrane repeat protein